MVFSREKSYVTDLLETLDQITKSLVEGFSINVVYLEFLKALIWYDMVPHRRLVQKLKGYDIKDDLLNLF